MIRIQAPVGVSVCMYAFMCVCCVVVSTAKEFGLWAPLAKVCIGKGGMETDIQQHTAIILPGHNWTVFTVSLCTCANKAVDGCSVNILTTHTALKYVKWENKTKRHRYDSKD